MTGKTSVIHPAELEDTELVKLCKESRDRASGPGGQHRNKVETRITLVHTATGLSGMAGERRSQAQNRQTALFRLRLNLALEMRVPRQKKSNLWIERTKTGRISCNAKHRDFPALIAEALDVLYEVDWTPSKAACHLSCSGSQLIKFLKQYGPAFERLNAERTKAGLRPLR